MLEGNEVEGKIGDAGGYSVDVNEKGHIKIEAKVEKDFGHTQVSSTNVVQTDIFKVAEEITKKTAATWDDKAVATLKSLLGIQ